MSMSDNDRIDLARIEGRILPISFAYLFQTLKQSAIDKYFFAAMFEQIFRTGNRSDSAVKSDCCHCPTIQGDKPNAKRQFSRPQIGKKHGKNRKYFLALFQVLFTNKEPKYCISPNKYRHFV